MIETLESKSVNKEELILHWRKHPVQAARDIFDIDLDNHQRIFINTCWNHDTVIGVISRGCGKTFCDGLFAALRALLLPGHRVGLIGPSYRQSKNLFAEVEKLYEKSPLFQESCVRAPARTPESCYVKFKSAPGKVGSFIEALPLGSDGSKIRGARYYDVIADEGAQIDNDIMNIVVRGFLSTNAGPMEAVRLIREQREKIKQGIMTEEQLIRPEANKFIMTSTAYYQYNHLWVREQKVINEIMEGYRTAQREGKDTSKYALLGGPLNGGQIPHRVLSNGKIALNAFTYKDPSEGFMNLQTIEDARRDMSDYMFRMEFEAFSPPDSEGFFRRSTLDRCRQHTDFACVFEPRKGMHYTMGVDPARNNDNFAVAIWEVDPMAGSMNLVRVMTWNNKNFAEMHRALRRIIKHYGMKYFKMDAGGGGTTIRDLMADPINCPPGEKLLLEYENEQHKVLTGEKILGPLVQFSNYDWVHDTNHGLLSAIQHGKVRIAAQPPLPGQAWTQDLEDADQELEEAINEMCSIIPIPVGSRMRWDTPTKNQRKDRYSAILVGYDAAQFVLNRHNRPQTLAMGFWG